MPRRAILISLAALVGLALVATWLWMGAGPAPPAPPAIDWEDIETPAVLNPGYVGPAACVECHDARVKQMQGTRHFQAAVAPEGRMPAAFADGPGTYTPTLPGTRWEMSCRGGHYRVDLVRDGRRFPNRVDLVYGSRGGLDEVYFTWRGDDLHELPVSWLHPGNRWGNVPTSHHRTDDLSRTTTPRCLECHFTWIEYRRGTANSYRRDGAIPGVTCERCHGPGRGHIDFHKANPGQPARRITHPRWLARERRIEVCTQCHSNAFQLRTHPFTYRPGEVLEGYYRTGTGEHPEDDHVANQIKYLRRGRCFQKSQMTCTTCHDPHRPTDPAAVAAACLKCHEPSACRDAPRLPEAVRGECVSCHLPARTWMNVHFNVSDDEFVPPIRRHDHRIAVHKVARQETLRRWLLARQDAPSREEAARIGRSLAAHWLEEARRHTAARRHLAAIGACREALLVDGSPAVRARLREAVATQGRILQGVGLADRLAETGNPGDAEKELLRLLGLKPDLSWAHFKLGKLYTLAGDPEKAAAALRLAARFGPDDARPRESLGWMAYQRGDAAEALRLFTEADAVQPYASELRYMMGLALRRLKRLDEAAARLREAIDIGPGNAGAHQVLSDVLRHRGEKRDAVRHARRAAALTGEKNPDVLLTLAEAYAAAGHKAEAEAAGRRALGTGAAGPDLVLLIHSRMEAWRRGSP